MGHSKKFPNPPIWGVVSVIGAVGIFFQRSLQNGERINSFTVLKLWWKPTTTRSASSFVNIPKLASCNVPIQCNLLSLFGTRLCMHTFFSFCLFILFVFICDRIAISSIFLQENWRDAWTFQKYNMKRYRKCKRLLSASIGYSKKPQVAQALRFVLTFVTWTPAPRNLSHLKKNRTGHKKNNSRPRGIHVNHDKSDIL